MKTRAQCAAFPRARVVGRACDRYLFAFMPHLFRSLLALAGLAGLAGLASSLVAAAPAAAQGVPGLGPARPQKEREPKTGEELVRARAFVVGDAKPGATVRVAVAFEIHPGWHIYWENSGESGTATEIAFDLPAGCTAPRDARERLAIEFPVPQVFEKGETTFGYEGLVVLSVPVTLPAEIPAGGLPVRVRSNWLVCKELCLFGRNEADADLAKPASSDSADGRLLGEWLARRPAALPTGAAATAGAPTVALEQADGATELVVSWPVPAGNKPAAVRFIPFDTPGVLLESGYMAASNDSPLRVALRVSPENALGGRLEVGGLLLVGDGKNATAHSFRLPIPKPASGGE